MMKKMMKKAGIMMMVVSMALGCSAFAAPCEKTEYVTASSLSVRTAPDVNSQKVGELAHGVDVRVVDDANFNGWTKIDYNGMTRYVCNSYLSTAKPEDSSLSWLKTASNVAKKSDYNVNVESGYLALRTSPSFDASNEIAQLQNGTKVELINNGEGTYWYVRIPSTNQSGYVNSNYLK